MGGKAPSLDNRMVTIISINTGEFLSLNRVFARVRRLPDTAVPDAIREWGNVLERDMKNSAFQADIKPFTGSIYSNGIEWRQRQKGLTGMLFMRRAYVYLDSMQPHWVNVTGSRRTLLAWALQAKSSSVRFQARMVQQGIIKKFGIHVSPHPFIQRGYNRSIKKLTPILNKHYDMRVKG